MRKSVSREQVVAFRVGTHHLGDRLPADGLLVAAGACGIQNSPPGSALLALAARVQAVTTDGMARAVADDKGLLQTWSLRGAPFFFPTADAAVFTTGVLPPTEAALRHFLPSLVAAVDGLAMTMTEAVDLARQQIAPVLADARSGSTTSAPDSPIGSLQRCRPCSASDGRNRARSRPASRWARRSFTSASVSSRCRVWSASRHASTTPRRSSWSRTGCHTRSPRVDPTLARAALLRRNLHCYGPSTPRDFAAWVGVAAGDADSWWRLVAEELTSLDVGGTAWLLTKDLDALRSAPRPDGVRILPPRDPYTQLHDRGTILDEGHHRTVWRSTGEPGTILADGRVAGTWRPRKTGPKLLIAVASFRALSSRTKTSIQTEADRVAPLRGARTVSVTFTAQP